MAVASGEESAHDLTPLVWRGVWRVGRKNIVQVDVEGQPGFPGAKVWVALPLSAMIYGPDGDKTPRKGVEMAIFWGIGYVANIGATPVSA